MIAIGVDTGVSGALACVHSHLGLLELASIPTRTLAGKGTTRREVDALALACILADWSSRFGFAREHVVGMVEKPALVGAGVGRQVSPTTLLSQGDSFGVIRASLAAACDRVERTTPQAWKRFYGLTSHKPDSVAAARALYPTQTPARFSHDKAEAVLIAHWAAKTLS